MSELITVSKSEWEYAKYCREVVNRLKEWFEPWRDENEDDYQGSSVDLRVDIKQILGGIQVGGI